MAVLLLTSRMLARKMAARSRSSPRWLAPHFTCTVRACVCVCVCAYVCVCLCVTVYVHVCSYVWDHRPLPRPAHLDQHELKVDVGLGREVRHILHKHQLVQLPQQLVDVRLQEEVRARMCVVCVRVCVCVCVHVCVCVVCVIVCVCMCACARGSADHVRGRGGGSGRLLKASSLSCCWQGAWERAPSSPSKL